MVRNEIRQHIGESRLSTCGSSTDEGVLSLGNGFFQLFFEFRGYSFYVDEVFHLEFVRVELSNRQSYAVNTAGRNHSGHAAAIGKARVKDGLRLGNVIA